jgi:transcriptional regulator with XRE-family HTH domain
MLRSGDMTDKPLTVGQVVGRNVARIRKARGLRQDEFGEALGKLFGEPWDRRTIGKTEGGRRRIDVEELVAFAEVLDVPISAFFESEPGEEVLVGRWPISAHRLSAGFLTPETQERLGTIVELGTLFRQAGDIRGAVQEVERLQSGQDDLVRFIDEVAADWEALIPKSRKRSQKRSKPRGGTKK